MCASRPPGVKVYNAGGTTMDVVFNSFSQLFDTTISGLQNDVCFRSGFLSAIQWVIVAGVLFVFFKVFKYFFDRIAQFFKPTKPVVTLTAPEGPSPFASFAQMAVALVVIAVMVFAIYSVATTS